MENYIYKQVESIIFGILGPEEIKKMGSVKIVTPELYDKEGYPVDGGLMDIRLGVIDPGLRCRTCGGKLKECTGHFGYMDLARPIIHVKYVKNILDILRSVCRECGRILIEDKDISKDLAVLDRVEKEKGADQKRRRAKEIINTLKKIKKCPHCKAKQYNIKVEKPTTFYEGDKRLNPIEIRTRFERISEHDAELLGLNPKYARPEWMIITIMPIPPVTMRPSITLESGERSEDDLTHKLGDIVRINQRLFENINAGAPEIIIEDLWDLLQYHITTYFDNSIAQIPPARHRSGQPLKTLTERIKSKEGRFRHNLAGKRVNYAARTVISPDPKIKFNEVGIPKEVALELTIPERVNEWNIKELREYIKRGPKIYPGANYVVRADGKKKKITEETKEQLLEELEPGYIVERHLMDGDIAIFNRQPSLHRMSIMCHRLKILPGISFRLNPGVCVAPDTKIDLSSGIKRKIDELKNCWKESELATFDWEEKIVKSTELKKFWGLKPEEYKTKCYKLSTKETGKSVIVTADHPFYTDEGIKSAKDIKIGNKVIVRPSDTPDYKEINRILVTKDNLKVPKTYIKHSLRVLEALELLPLNIKDQRIMIIARLLGHLFGDGTFILKDHTARLMFRGRREDLVTIQNDIRSLGFEPEKIYIRSSNGEIRTIKGKKLRVIGKGASFEIRNKPLAILFNALGAPNGDKVRTDVSVPKWILNAPNYIKREFLAAYFGSELSSPALRYNSKTNFRNLRFKLSKIENKVDSGIKFINQVKDILEEFGIKISSISKELGNIRKDGSKTISLTAIINLNKSHLNLFGKIGYIYSKSRDDKARLAYQYLIMKDKEIRKRKNIYKKFFELRKKGLTFKKIAKRFNIPIGVLEDWAYRNYNAGLISNFIGFEEWSKKITKDIENTGLVWETIKEKTDYYVPFVYDVTTTLDTHNFFANGFLTKNCFPYNADFDGDEMNLHIPQTEEARAEAEILMQVQTQMITPKNGLNVIGCIQDSISGNYILTKELKLTREEATEILISIGLNDLSRLKNKAMLNGKEIFSAVLPKGFNVTGKANHCKRHEKCKKENCEYDAYVCVQNGDLICGIIDNSSIGEESGNLLRELHRKYGEDKAVELTELIFRLGIAVLLKRGFTTAISDTDLLQETKLKIKEIITEAEKQAEKYVSLYNEKKLEVLPGKTRKETLEAKILEVLNKVRNKIGELLREHSEEENPTIIMAKSGARGNIINLVQMAASVGQQALRGRRIEKGYTDRTLPIFKKGDLGPAAHGFIESSLKQGLNPYEYFFGAMTGRDALMDTALRTPKSGYLYRRLANALQDLKIEYDQTVRDANKSIIQFKYGEDGVDVSKSEEGIINVEKAIRDVKG